MKYTSFFSEFWLTLFKTYGFYIFLQRILTHLLRGEHWIGGGGQLLSGKYYFQHELGRKIYFHVKQGQNIYFHPQQNFEAKTKRKQKQGMFAKREGRRFVNILMTTSMCMCICILVKSSNRTLFHFSQSKKNFKDSNLTFYTLVWLKIFIIFITKVWFSLLKSSDRDLIHWKKRKGISMSTYLKKNWFSS